MPDLAHQFGGDLGLSATGALALSQGPQLGLERVLRRLMTNAGAYIWQPAYGAGLPATIGQPAQAARLKALIFAQLMREALVAKKPPPVVDVTTRADGTVFASVRYTDAGTGLTQSLTTPVV